MPRKDRILSLGEGTESLLSRIIAYGYFVRNRIVRLTFAVILGFKKLSH